MRVLLINNFFHEHGGVERVFFHERALLQSHGHTVIDFSTHSMRNKPSPYTEFFVSGLDFHAAGDFFAKAARFFYSREVDQKLSALIQKTRPDVAHIHGIFDVLGPTVLWTLHRCGVKIIFTAHAYKLICPNWKLFSRGAVDEACKKNPFHDAFTRSVQHSYVKSFGAAFAWKWHEWRGTFGVIDRIISPSQFLIDKHVEFGWRREKFLHIPNPVVLETAVAARAKAGDEKQYLLFVGRLVPEKGVAALVRAMARMPEENLIVVGDGPCLEELRLLAHAIGAKNISFVGKKSSRDVAAYVRCARAVLVPSVWYENDSLAVLEAQAAGKLVIASYIGGIPEQIQHGITGLLFEAGNVDGLCRVVRQANALSSAQRRAIGIQAQKMVALVRDPELYYESLIAALTG